MYIHHLTARDHQVVATIEHFRQVSSHQLERLHFADGSEASRGVRCRRTLIRLIRWQLVKRLERSIGGGPGGSEGYIYIPVGSTMRAPNPHTLDITELYVRLHEAGDVVFEPEPYCHQRVGERTLKPDAYVVVDDKRWHLEVDRGTEWPAQIRAKLNLHLYAWEHWPDERFPRVLFVVAQGSYAPARKRLIERQIASLSPEDQEPFAVCLFDDALSLMTLHS